MDLDPRNSVNPAPLPFVSRHDQAQGPLDASDRLAAAPVRDERAILRQKRIDLRQRKKCGISVARDNVLIVAHKLDNVLIVAHKLKGQSRNW